METNNLTFKQHLILAMTHAYINSQTFDSFTDEVSDRIRELSDKLSQGMEGQQDRKPGIPLDASLYDYGLRLSPLMYNDIDTVGDLVQRSSVELLKLRNFGKGALFQVEAFLGRYNLKLKDR